jgi:hypothetical protein
LRLWILWLWIRVPLKVGGAVNRYLVVRVAAALAGAVVLASSPAAATALTSDGDPVAAWVQAEEVPGTATLNAGANAQITSVSCAAAGNCSAGGYYTDSAGNEQVFVTSQI